MRLYLVRHGQSYGTIHFIPGAVRPKTDPLTVLGHKQAQDAANFLKSQETKPTLIISSPYTRTLDTAKTIRNALGIPLEEDDRLREYNLGGWDGIHIDEYGERFDRITPDKRYTFRPPYGESWLDEARRIKAVIEQADGNGHSCIVLVSHFDPIKASVNLLTSQPADTWGAPAGYAPGSITILDKTPVSWKIISS